MKYVKILGLLAVAAAALMAFAASASATTITGGNEHTHAITTTEYTGTIHAHNENGHVKLANPIANIECASTVHGLSLTHGAGVTAKGNINSLTFTGCTNSWHVTTVTPGSLEIHAVKAGHGTLTSSGARVETTRFGIKCFYETNNTDVGTLTDSHTTKGHATLHVAASIPIGSGSSGLCGTGSAKWEGAYTVTTPKTLYIGV